MEKECLLSVIIPAFNAETTIGRAVSSICQQHSADVEVIVVDDGSTDATVNEFRLLPYKNARLLQLEKNCGQGTARNHGIENAKGKYISFVDADDWVSDDFTHSIITSVRNAPDVELFLFGVRAIQPGGIQQTAAPNVNDLLSAFVIDKVSCTPWGKIYLREKINNHTIRFEDLKPGEDIVFNAKYLRRCKTHKVITDLYYNYDCRQPSTTRRPYSLEVINAHHIANEILKQQLSALVEDFDNKYFARSFRYFFMHSMWRMASDRKNRWLSPSVKTQVEDFLRSEFKPSKVILSNYLTIKEKAVFSCFSLFKPLAHYIFDLQLR